MRSGPFHDDDKAELEQVIVMAKVVDPIERKGGMRLNASMKNEVLEKAMTHGFDKRKAALLKEELQLSKLFYLKAFGAAAIKHAQAIEHTPFVNVNRDHYGKKLAKDATVSSRWNVGGQTVDVAINPEHPRDAFSGYWKQPYTIKDETLVERCRTWQADKEKYKADYAKTAATLTGMLGRITTYPSLEKNWPAGVKFYQHLPKAYPFRHQVPAILIDELNASLGLA